MYQIFISYSISFLTIITIIPTQMELFINQAVYAFSLSTYHAMSSWKYLLTFHYLVPPTKMSFTTTHIRSFLLWLNNPFFCASTTKATKILEWKNINETTRNSFSLFPRKSTGKLATLEHQVSQGYARRLNWYIFYMHQIRSCSKTQNYPRLKTRLFVDLN